jgi:bacteriocin resistance YdeI/OmpD-like protein
VTAAYRARPPYQQNDYIGWILRATRPETRIRRIRQMLNEPQRGDRYMNMAYRPKLRAVKAPAAPRTVKK